MLILVGVTINFAINGGIINKAKSASSEMQKAADKEELQLAIIASMDYLTDEINETELKSNLPNWTITGNGPYTCTSPSGNVFTVALNGTITETGEVTPGEQEQSGEEPDMDFYISEVSEEQSLPGKMNGMGALITKNGSFVFTSYYKNEPIVMTNTILLVNLLGQMKTFDNYTVYLNGEKITYEKAIIGSTKLGGNQYKLNGYIKNNKIYNVDVEGDTDDENNFDENNNMINYTSITLTNPNSEEALEGEDYIKASLPNPSSFGLDIYEYKTEYGTHLISFNKSKNVLYKGGRAKNDNIMPSDEALDHVENIAIPTYIKIFGIYDYDFYISRLEYIVVDTFEAHLSDGTTKTYNNVIVTTQEDIAQDGIVNGRNTPVGYINNDGDLVMFNCEYSGRDENGYPVEYTKWEELVYTKR